MTAPQVFRWSGDSMIPLRPKLADKEYVIGQTYRLAEIEERSAKSHDHFFAAVSEIWSNLPEELAERFPTAEHWRKHALIRTGYHDVSEFVAASKAEAIRLAAYIRGLDEYSAVIVKDNVVRRLTAKSQSKKAMGREDFQKSKTAVLEWCAAQIGVKPDQIGRAA